MKKMGLNEIRESYLSFFESKGHLRLPSFSLIPKNDKSLLIINSGMAPLKPYFTGLKVPPRKRVTTCQRCVRTNDVENVGKTIRHGTFFEMLGNFSFGDYFKKEVIPWAWEFLTGVLELPKDKLYITIYEDDEEAFDIWTKNAGVAPSHIFRFGKEENFWEHGTGPCGPCSEIHYNRENTEVKTKEEFLKAGDEDRVVELWNLVFTQFDKDAKGNYNKLKFPNIDTGMGLERIATIMQGTNNIFEVDTIKDIINSVCDMSGEKYGIDDKKDISVRIIVDHIRSITFMISDGILPSNEGRGYVLRRLLRRAERHGKMIGFNEPFLYKVCDSVIKNSCESYPELREREGYIKKVIKIEEERFHETIDIGMNILKGFVNDIKSRNENILSGESAFKLYDTYGFPLELTEEIIEEEGITVDKDSFKKEMEKQRTRAKSAREESNYMGRDIGIIQKIPKETKSEFKGYTNLTCESVVNTIIKGDEFVSILNEGDEGIVVTDETPFYAEMGGQVGDTGIIENTGMSSEITDCKKNISGKILHFVKVTKGSLKLDDKVRLSVNEIRRKSICKNHTATHILDSALKTVVGDFVKQAGSYVDDIRLRFDFNNFAPLTKEEISKVETIVNANIEKAVSVDTKVMNIEEAKKTGAIALFDDKYKDEVRVVSVGDFSKEFCGGTHVKNSGEIGLFKIVSETGIAAGIRRIEAVTGIEAIKYFEQKEDILNKAQSLLKCSDKEVIQRIEALNKTIKDDNKTISEIKAKLNSGVFDEIVKNSYDVRGVKVAAKVLTDMDADSSRDLADKIKEKLGCGIVILALKDDKKVQFIAMATKEAVSKGIHCGKIVKELSSICQGGGGGRPDMAQAGGKDVSKLDEAVSKIKLIIEKYVK